MQFVVVQISIGAKQNKPKKDCLLCSHCGGLDHIKDECFKLDNYHPYFKNGKHNQAMVIVPNQTD